MKRSVALGSLWLILVGIVAGVGAYCALVPSRAGALRAFAEYGKRATDGVTEDMQMDPLIVARGDVVPDVLAAITSSSMPKRRYAIAFLGNTERPEAIPPLERILRDEREDILYRGDALEAIAMIDSGRGRQLATEFAGRTDYLGDSAREVMAGVRRSRRTYSTALRGFLCVRLTGC